MMAPNFQSVILPPLKGLDDDEVGTMGRVAGRSG